MPKVGKIQKHDLGPRILSLLTEEGKGSKQIAAILTEEGFKLSQPTVSRWIKQQRENHEDEVQDIIRKHVTGVLPNDLQALEDMEEQCLAWAKEGPDTKAERIGLWEKVKANFREWQGVLLSISLEVSEKDLKKAMDPIIKQCLNWILEDINIQKERIGAMRMGSSIIDIKLKYSALLEGAKAGSIIIRPAKSGDEPTGDTVIAAKDCRLHLVPKEDDAE